MNWWNRLLRGRRMDEQLDKELRFHLDQQIADLIGRGVAPDEARRQAQLAFGGPTQVAEDCREARGTRWLLDMVQDLRFGLRSLLNKPGFAIASVATLALGIGANITVFSIVYGVVFRPLPYPHPHEIVQLIESSPSGSDEKDVTYKELQFLKQQGSPLEFLAGYTVVGSNLSVSNRTERVKVVPVSVDYFHVLGIKPLLGRDFLPEEDQGNGAHVLILSYERWQRQAGADPGIIGRTITLDAEPYTVIGVMPPHLEATIDPILPGDTDVWTPLALVGRTVGEGENIAVLGRLRPGISFAQARAKMTEITPEFRKVFPLGLVPSTTLTIQSYQSMLSNDVRTILLVLFGAVGFVL